MWKQDHFGNAKRWLCFGKRHKIANWLSSKVRVHGTDFPDGTSMPARPALSPAMFSARQATQEQKHLPWRCLFTEIDQTVVLTLQDNRNDFRRDWLSAHIHHADRVFVPAQSTGTVAASWVAGKRTKGGMATLWNMEIIISDTLCWEKGDEGGEEAKVKNLNTNIWKSCQETLILLKVPWTFLFQFFDGNDLENNILWKGKY